jgi:hypothetical protein
VTLFGCTPKDAVVVATKLGGEIMMKGDELGRPFRRRKAADGLRRLGLDNDRF